MSFGKDAKKILWGDDSEIPEVIMEDIAALQKLHLKGVKEELESIKKDMLGINIFLSDAAIGIIDMRLAEMDKAIE